MTDIFGIAKSGLQAYKEGLATTGQNIANVGNENYARREVNLTELKSPTSDVLSISSGKNYGVKVDGMSGLLISLLMFNFRRLLLVYHFLRHKH